MATPRRRYYFAALGTTVLRWGRHGAPVAEFIGAPVSGTAPHAVTFTDLSVGTVESWLWDFGDGQTSMIQNPTHVYSAAGAYTVALTVTGPGGTNTRTLPAYITTS